MIALLGCGGPNWLECRRGRQGCLMADWKSRSHRWWNSSVPEWVRGLTDFHYTRELALNSDVPPVYHWWFGKRGIWIIGAVLIFFGYLLELCTPYLSNALSGLGTTLMGLSVYWWLVDRRVRPSTASLTVRSSDPGEERPELRPAPRAGPGPRLQKGREAASAKAPSPAPRTVQTAPMPQTVPVPQAGMRLHTADGARKYLTAGERDAFLREAEQADRAVRTLCMTLAYAGCRLSEALALTADRVDLAAGVLVFESLKKRRTGIYRASRSPLPCSTRSTWCTASASCRPAAARAAACGSGPGAG